MKQIPLEVANIISLLLQKPVTPGENIAMGISSSWDSLKQIEIIMTLEEHFQITFAPEEIPQLTSLTALTDKVQLLLQRGLDD